jgi:hypothetical protein
LAAILAWLDFFGSANHLTVYWFRPVFAKGSARGQEM